MTQPAKSQEPSMGRRFSPPFAALSPTTTPTNPRSGRPSRRRPNRSRRRRRRRCFPRRRRRRPRRPLLASKPNRARHWSSLGRGGSILGHSRSHRVDGGVDTSAAGGERRAQSRTAVPHHRRLVRRRIRRGGRTAARARGGEERSRLLSNATSAAVDSAFNTLAQTVLMQNARTLEDLVREMLRPMLKCWLDDNLPGMVERLVRAEIERVRAANELSRFVPRMRGPRSLSLPSSSDSRFRGNQL